MLHATPWQGVAADNKLIKFNLKQTVAFRQASRGRKKKCIIFNWPAACGRHCDGAHSECQRIARRLQIRSNKKLFVLVGEQLQGGGAAEAGYKPLLVPPGVKRRWQAARG